MCDHVVSLEKRTHTLVSVADRCMLAKRDEMNKQSFDIILLNRNGLDFYEAHGKRVRKYRVGEA